MSAFWFSLLVNTAYFLADVFIKLGSIQLKAGRLVYIRSLFSLGFASIWLLASGELMHLPSFPVAAALTGCSILCGIGLYYYIQALRHMHFVNVAVIGICGAFIHYSLGVVLFNEQVNAWFFLAALLSVGGIIIQWRKTKDKKGMLEAVISAICWGFGYALLSLPLEHTSAIWGTWIMEGTILLMSVLFLIGMDPEYSLLKPDLLNWKLALVAFFTILGSVMINISYQKFSLNILGFMQLAFFPYSIIAGYLLFKEKLNKWEWLGNTLVVAGLIVYFVACQ